MDGWLVEWMVVKWAVLGWFHGPADEQLPQGKLFEHKNCCQQFCSRWETMKKSGKSVEKGKKM